MIIKDFKRIFNKIILESDRSIIFFIKLTNLLYIKAKKNGAVDADNYIAICSAVSLDLLNSTFWDDPLRLSSIYVT